DERDPRRRAKRVTLAKRRLNKAGFGRHRDLAKSIQTRLASLEGARPSINPATGLQEFRVAGRMRGAGFDHSNPFDSIDPFAGRGMGFVSPGSVVPGGSNPSQVSIAVGGNNTSPQAGPPPAGVETIPVTAPRPQPPVVPVFRPPHTNLQPNIGPPVLPPAEDVLPADLDPRSEANFLPDAYYYDAARENGEILEGISNYLSGTGFMYGVPAALRGLPGHPWANAIGLFGTGASFAGQGLNQWADSIGQRCIDLGLDSDCR
ncbi:MAG: hypothetical protein RIB43_16735, partial [Rhodospirillaceae bacterium]